MRTTMMAAVAMVMAWGSSACTPDRGRCQGGGVRDTNTGLCECPEGTELRESQCVTIDDGGAVEEDGGDSDDASEDGGTDASAADAAPDSQPEAGPDAEVNTFDAAGLDPLPDAAVPAEGALHVALGDSHACAVVAGGSVVCWGSNSYGQTTNAPPAGGGVAQPAAVASVANAVSVGAGTNATCAVLRDGTVKCWGRVLRAALPDGTLPRPPETVVGVANATAVDVGYAHACALISDGTVVCWGENNLGQLGNASAPAGQTPVVVPGVTGAKSIAVSDDISCAVLETGAVSCWGRGFDSMYISASGTYSNIAPRVVATGATGFSAAINVRCAVVDDDSASVQCVGYNNLLGDGIGGSGLTSVTTPTTVQGLTDVVGLSASNYRVCAIRNDGSVSCWGQNSGKTYSGGLLGGLSSLDWFASATKVVGLVGATQVASGQNFSCAIVASGNVMCWGGNERGQLGDGSAVASPRPIAVALPQP